MIEMDVGALVVAFIAAMESRPLSWGSLCGRLKGRIEDNEKAHEQKMREKELYSFCIRARGRR